MTTEFVSVSDTTAAGIPFRRLKVWFNNFVITMFGLIAGLIISEGVLALLKPPPIRWYYPQPLHLPDKELGWVMRPGQHSYTHDKAVAINTLGFRSPEISIPKEPRSLRILCLGDSQTFGNGVGQDETYPARLESILRAQSPHRSIQVINAGIQGYDTVQEVGLLERITPVLRPDIVTLGFYLNDIVEVEQPKNRFAVDAATGEFPRIGLIKQFTPYKLIYLLKRSRIVTFVYWQYQVRRMNSETNIIKAVLLGKTPPTLEPPWKIIEQNLMRAQVLAKTQHFHLLVFPIPAIHEFVGNYPQEQYRSRFMALAKKLGLDSIDPTPELRSKGGAPETYFIPWDGHINPLTHNLIAELLANQRTFIDAVTLNDSRIQSGSR